MLLVYTSVSSNRINYLFGDILAHFLGISVEHTSDWSVFLNSLQPKCTYTKEPIEDYPWIQSHDLLFQQDIQPVEIHVETFRNIPCFFKCHENSLLPYDWFSATFYLLTRYEEVLSTSSRDTHGRFLPNASLALKNEFVKIPVVDYWMMFIREILSQKFSELVFSQPQFNISLSIDVDHIYAHLEKPWFEILGVLTKNAVKGNFQKSKSILSTLFLKARDPFDYFQVWKDLSQKIKFNSVYFFMYCGQKGQHDPAFYITKHIKRIILDLKSWAKLAIHPSYKAFQNTTQTIREKQILEDIIQDSVVCSRQHFICLQIPNTYDVLEGCGITDDFTMGYPNVIGFRAGTGHAFRFFNVLKNQSSNITVHPFQITDIALFLSGNLEQAKEDVRQVIQHARKVGTSLFFLCHSHALCDRFDNTSYFDVLTSLFHEAKSVK